MCSTCAGPGCSLAGRSAVLQNNGFVLVMRYVRDNSPASTPVKVGRCVKGAVSVLIHSTLTVLNREQSLIEKHTVP